MINAYVNDLYGRGNECPSLPERAPAPFRRNGTKLMRRWRSHSLSAGVSRGFLHRRALIFRCG